MKLILRCILLVAALTVALTASAREWRIEDVPRMQVQDSTRLVSNPDGILQPATEAQINTLLRDIRSKSTAEVVVMVLDSIEGGDIDTWAVDLFEQWGIGKKDKDNGVLVLIVPGQRQYTIKTGYGTEGILPTVVLARMTRRGLEPLMKEGHVDEAVLSTAQSLHSLMTTPDAIAELRSDQKSRDDDFSLANIVTFVLTLAFMLTLLMALVSVVRYYPLRKANRYDKYLGMESTVRMMRMMCWCTLGMGLVVYLPLKSMMHSWRDGRHACPNCGADMKKVDEAHDNDYLTPAQDTEEKISSVDYDVWLCPQCGERDIYAYDNPDTAYTVCPVCHARACRLTCDRVLMQPTEMREGAGVKEYTCLNCHNMTRVPYKIAKLASATPIIIPGGGGGRGGGFGGGFGGGGFGGGSASGGGVTGGW